MANSTLVGLLFEAWNDLDRVTETLEPDEANVRHPGTSSVAWTLAHVGTVLDAWINSRFQGLPAHPFPAKRASNLAAPASPTTCRPSGTRLSKCATPRGGTSTL